MPAYVPNAADVTQPTEDKFVESAALEFRTAKAALASQLSSLLALQGTIAGFDAAITALYAAVGAGTNSVALAANLANTADPLLGDALVGVKLAAANTIARTQHKKNEDVVTVDDFSGTDSEKFARAWAYIKTRGGDLKLNPRDYTLDETAVFDVDQTLPHQYRIYGYGAQIFCSPAVIGHAIQVFKGYNNFGLKLEGLQFNHRNNNTVNGCIQAQGATHLKIINCGVEHHNTKAGYSGIELGPYTPGIGDTNSFWSIIDGFTTRVRSSGDGTDAAIGIKLKGVANATTITNCSFVSVVDAIRFETDGITAGAGNSVKILVNKFEGVTNAITVNTAAPETHAPTGLLVSGNRVEAVDTFFRFIGAAVLDSGNPPILQNNYLTVGSVTNYISNPNNQLVWIWEPSYFGVGTSKNVIGSNKGFQFQMENAGSNFELARQFGGPGSWDAAHLVLCGYHFWVESSTGKLRMKGSPPTFDADGVVVGTQV